MGHGEQPDLAHRLRTPLAVIVGYIEILALRDKSGGSTARSSAISAMPQPTSARRSTSSSRPTRRRPPPPGVAPASAEGAGRPPADVGAFTADDLRRCRGGGRVARYGAALASAAGGPRHPHRGHGRLHGRSGRAGGRGRSCGDDGRPRPRRGVRRAARARGVPARRRGGRRARRDVHRRGAARAPPRGGRRGWNRGARPGRAGGLRPGRLGVDRAGPAAYARPAGAGPGDPGRPAPRAARLAGALLGEALLAAAQGDAAGAREWLAAAIEREPRLRDEAAREPLLAPLLV